MNKKIINVFLLTLSVLFLIYGITFKVFDKLDYPDFFRIMALAYTFFVYSVLRIKNALNGEIFLEAFKITIVIYAFYAVFLFFRGICQKSQSCPFLRCCRLHCTFIFFLISACAAERRATGTRYGEQLT